MGVVKTLASSGAKPKQIRLMFREQRYQICTGCGMAVGQLGICKGCGMAVGN
jgi:hypothetical protein